MKKLVFIALLSSTMDICVAQSIDVENDRFPGVSTLTIRSFNGCCAKKGYRAKYYFNDQGQAVKSKNFFKMKKLSQFDYRYDSLGNLTHKIQTYSINGKDKTGTTLIQYVYDADKRISRKASRTPAGYSWTEEYPAFNDIGKPGRTISYSPLDNDTSIRVVNYNEYGRVVKIMYEEADSLRTAEILDYNQHGDLSYSLIPRLVRKEDEPPLILIGGNRHAAEERYEYTYDIQSRWIEKYVVFKDKMVLLETRKYK